MRKNFVFVFLLLCCGMYVHCAPASGQITPDLALSEADRALPIVGLDQFLDMVTEQNFQLYGFADFADVHNVKPGLALQLYTIDPQSILRYRSGTSIEDIIEPTRQCYIPLLIRGKPQCMVLASIEADGALNVVSLGYANLARQLYAAFSSADVHPEQARLVVVYQAREFFLSEKSRPYNLYPIQNTYEAGLMAEPSLELNLSRIRASVETALQEGR
jgi:hypothetical protein